MSRRLYFGKLAPDTRRDELERLVEPYGTKVEVRVMTGFGFVEFESSRDAEDAIRDLNGKTFLGAPIVVEFAKESTGRRNFESYDRGGYAPRTRRPPGFRVHIDNVHRDTSWQDLKDFGREAGNVSFSDIDRDVPGRGILEYITREDAEFAVRTLDGKELRGQVLRVTLGDDRGGPDNFRRDDRDRRDRYVRDREDRFRDDRYREDRYSEDRPRRRSISPRRGDERVRSPPPPRSKDYGDDRRSARVEDYDRVDRRRDDRDRYPSSRSTGDAGYSR